MILEHVEHKYGFKSKFKNLVLNKEDKMTIVHDKTLRHITHIVRNAATIRLKALVPSSRMYEYMYVGLEVNSSGHA